MKSDGQVPDPRQRKRNRTPKLPKDKEPGRPPAPEPKNVTVPGRQTRPVHREKR